MLGRGHARNFKIIITNFFLRYVVYEFGNEKHKGNVWICSFKPYFTKILRLTFGLRIITCTASDKSSIMHVYVLITAHLMQLIFY